MAIYELRTYTLYVGKLGEAVKLYGEQGWPALEAGGFSKHLIGYFTSDVGTINQLVHLWKFEDDAERRAFWGRLFQDEAFMNFAAQIRGLMESTRKNLKIRNMALLTAQQAIRQQMEIEGCDSVLAQANVGGGIDISSLQMNKQPSG